jgi:hypothetical protein
MPDDIDVLFTPQTSLEKAVQFIQGGFSYRARKELGSNMEVWQKTSSDHRVCEARDDLLHVNYIRQNPIHQDLCDHEEEYPYSSAGAGIERDPIPQRLKPILVVHAYGAAEGARPSQSERPSAVEKALAQARSRKIASYNAQTH